MARQDAQQREEEKKNKRDQKRAAQRALELKETENLDILGMSKQGLASSANVYVMPGVYALSGDQAQTHKHLLTLETLC